MAMKIQPIWRSILSGRFSKKKTNEKKSPFYSRAFFISFFDRNGSSCNPLFCFTDTISNQTDNMLKRVLIALTILILFACPSVFGQLEFIENKGQWPVSYGLKAKLTHGEFWLSGNKAAFVLTDFGAAASDPKKHAHANPENARNHFYTMEFVGASKQVSLSGESRKDHYHNYYLSKNPNDWHSHVSLFEMARHQNLYPGIDLVWNDEKGNLKYQFELKKGANPSSISIEYKGLDKISLIKGNLILKTSIGTITEKKPVAWQEINGRKIPVTCQFEIQNGNKVGFRFPQGYNSNAPLVIDPVLVFSSFSGSRSDNWGMTATYGENGTAYAGGICLGTKFPTTPGAFSSSFSGDSTGTNIYSTYDISILKFSGNGNQLLYATYLGGSEAESPSSMVVDKNNNLVILGVTGSNDFPTTGGAYDESFNGGQSVSPYGPGEGIVRFRTGSDIVISKFSADGTQLVGSTFLGGALNDGIITLSAQGNSALVKNYGDAFRSEIAVDTTGRIYIASHTQSTNFPVAQAIQSTKSGSFDGICARFSASLSNLEFSTFLGGNGDDGAYSLQVSNEGKIFVSGGTTSTNFRTSTGTIKPTFGGNVDGFVCSFTPGLGLAGYRGTYIGTTDYDQAYFVQRDIKGNVYLFGQTLGIYPVTANVYSNPNSSQFIHSLTANLDTTRFSTVFGTGALLTNISPTAFLVDDCGQIYCSGWGGSTNNIPGYVNGFTTNMPTTPGAYSRNSDGSDFYIMVLAKNAQSLNFATYFGDTTNNGNGDHVDGGTSRFDKRGIVYQSVCAGCGAQSSFPTTPGVVSNTNRSNNCNNALFKYDFSLLKAKYQPSTLQGCAPLAVDFNSESVFASSYQWDFQDGPVVTTNFDTIQHVFDSAGTYQVKLIAINPEACPGLDSISRTIVVQDVPAFTGDSISFCSLQDTIYLPTLPSGNFSWNWTPTQFLSNSQTATVTVLAPTQTTVYTASVTSSLGCRKEATFKISNGILKAKAKADTLKGCKPLTIDFQSQSFQAKQISWFFGDGDSTINLTPDSIQSHTFQNAGFYKVRLKAENDTTCEKQSYDSLVVLVHELPYFGDTLIRYCEEGTVILKAAKNNGVKFSWSPTFFLNDPTLAQPVLSEAAAQKFNLTIQDSNQCSAKATIDLRDGRLKAQLGLSSDNLCTPVNLTLTNTSLNAQKSRYIWDGDSTETSGTVVIPLTITESGVTRVRLKVLSDTACLDFDETFQDITLGGIKPLTPINQTFCPGNSFQVSAVKKPGYSYTWPSFAQPGIDSSKASFNLGNDPLQFVIGLADSFQCPGSQEVNLSPSKPKAAFSPLTKFNPCFDILDYQLNANELPSTNYFWNVDTTIGLAGKSINYRFPARGTYPILLIADQNGCRDTTLQTIVINDPPLNLKADFEFVKSYDNCQVLPGVKVRNTSVGADQTIWAWDGNVSFDPEPTIVIREPMRLTLRLSAYQGLCLAEVTKEIDLQFISPPNLITQNQDGINDAFEIVNLPPKSKIVIRNRWGQLVFSSDDYQNNWNPPADFGTGFYEMTLPNGQSCKSWLKVAEK
jgi:hypothetical protein